MVAGDLGSDERQHATAPARGVTTGWHAAECRGVLPRPGVHRGGGSAGEGLDAVGHLGESARADEREDTCQVTDQPLRTVAAGEPWLCLLGGQVEGLDSPTRTAPEAP